MSKIFQEIFQRGRDARKPASERRRYSLDEDDAVGYRNYSEAKAQGKSMWVRLDGAPIEFVQTADEISGFVVAICMPLRVVGGEIATERKTGVVAVDLLAQW